MLINELAVPFFFGGTGLLIVVGVALDTLQQIESHLLMRHYDGFLKKVASGAEGVDDLDPSRSRPVRARARRRSCSWASTSACRTFPPAICSEER